MACKRQLLFLLLALAGLNAGQSQSIPHLARQGAATQLIVRDKPFIVLGGELGNSTATTMASMKPVWPKLKAMSLNTVLVPVYWELMESEEGQFDFALLRELIVEARNNDLKIVFLWFGSWKNSMSSHAPAWIKRNQEKYPRAKDRIGRSQEILSAFSDAVLQADIRAFEALMRFIKDFDGVEHTVVMVQVENEIGMLPSARDHHALAEAAFKKETPAELTQYLQKNKEKLNPEFLNVWKTNGYKMSGAWESVFGKGSQTDEIFMAWYYAKFANRVAEAGKNIYPLPMFVNAALNRPGREPGTYPSAGPLPHIMDVWKAAGSAIDFLSPDFYNPDFKYWCDLYTRQGDPLFIPEHAFDPSVGSKALYAVGRYEAIGFAPFSIESAEKPQDEPLGKAYRIIEEIKPLLSARAGQGKVNAALVSKAIPETIIRMGKYELSCKHDYTLSWTPGAKLDEWPPASAIIIQTDEDAFYIAGTGVVVTFKSVDDPGLNVGLLKVDEGNFEGENWIVRRHMNGDQTHQGRHVSIPAGQYAIQRVTLYTYK